MPHRGIDSRFAALGVCTIVANTACRRAEVAPSQGDSLPPQASPSAVPAPDDPFAEPRRRMVDEQIASRDVIDQRVLDAMRRAPRHRFVEPGDWDEAHHDHPVPIGFGQTISQPYIVARMTELAGISSGATVLEVGTGSGYQAAVLAELGAEVYSIEIVPELAQRASTTLAELGYRGVHVREGDGYRGWPEKAPFDAILVTAAPPSVPAPLLAQLKVGARLVIPVGSIDQHLDVITRTDSGYRTEQVLPVRFVPMTGEAQRRR